MRPAAAAILTAAVLAGGAVWLACQRADDGVEPEPPGHAEPAARRPAGVSKLPSRSDAGVDHAEPAEPSISLRGRVYVEGATPREPVELKLTWWTYADTPSRRKPPNERVAHTDSRGRFAFADLPSDWLGQVGARGYAVEDPETRHPVKELSVQPSSDELVLRLTRLPRLKGRVVERGGWPPVPGAEVRVRGSNAPRFLPSDRPLRADEAGRFWLDLRAGSSPLTIVATDAALEWMTQVEVDPSAIARDTHGDVDIGDLELAKRTLWIPGARLQGRAG